MKAGESLFEFMPYGAPELLQSRRERLASALLLSSLATTTAFLAAGGRARLIVPAVVIPPVSHFPGNFERLPVWTLPRPPAPPAAPHARAPSFAGVPVPVGEPDVPVVTDYGPASAPSAGPGLTPPACGS